MYLGPQLRQAGGLCAVHAAQLVGSALRLLGCALLQDCIGLASGGITNVAGKLRGVFSPRQVRRLWLNSGQPDRALRVTKRFPGSS